MASARHLLKRTIAATTECFGARLECASFAQRSFFSSTTTAASNSSQRVPTMPPSTSTTSARAAQHTAVDTTSSSASSAAASAAVLGGGSGGGSPLQDQLLNSATALRTPMIVPAFWTGTNAVDPERFSIDCGPYNLPALAEKLVAEGAEAVLPAELQQRMLDAYEDVGLVLLTNTGLGDSMSAMRQAASVVIKDYMEYKAGANSRHSIDVNVFDTGAPKEAWLHYHHEMAYVSKSTRMVGFCCAASVDDGRATGATFVSEGVGTTDAIMATPLGQKLRELGVTYIRNLTDGASGLDDTPENDDSTVYNHWQTSFGVETQEEVEALAAERGLDIEWGPNRFLKTRFTISAFEYFEPLQRNLLYTQIADDSLWFDTWPGVRKLPTVETFATASENDRALKLTFGDGSDFTREELQTFVDVYDAHGVRIDWHKGDVAILCNLRWAHGRPRYELGPGQRRELGVILGETYDRVGQRDDKW